MELVAWVYWSGAGAVNPAGAAEAYRVPAWICWTVCLLMTALWLGSVAATRGAWKQAGKGQGIKVSTERAERSCDAVLTVCTLLIPAGLGLLTWLYEKVVLGSFVIPIVFALGYLFALLVMTAHMRFNYLWRAGQEFEAGGTKDMRFAYWLTMATSSIVLGLALLAVPVLGLGFGWIHMKDEGKAAVAASQGPCGPETGSALPGVAPAGAAGGPAGKSNR